MIFVSLSLCVSLRYFMIISLLGRYLYFICLFLYYSELANIGATVMIYLSICLNKDHRSIFLYSPILLSIHFLIADEFVHLTDLFILFYFISIGIFNLVYYSYLKFGMIFVFIVQMLFCMYFFNFIINMFLFNSFTSV
jgi:hypothetical protein